MSADERWNDGLKVLEQVYGAGTSVMMQGLEDQPMVSETIKHLFGEIWSRPGFPCAISDCW